MWPLGVVGGLLSAGVVARLFLARDKVPPMERRQRALVALRDLAEHPRPAMPDLVPPPETPTDHVRILEERPAGARPARRASSRRTRAPRRKPRSTGAAPPIERPTIEIRSSPAHDRGPVVPAVSADASTSPAAEAAAAPHPILDRFARRRPTAYGSRVSAVAISAALVVAVLGIVTAVGLSGHSPARATAPKSHPDTTAKHRPVVSTTVSSAPPSTLPAPVAHVVSRSTNGATVSVHSPFRLTLHASGTCWVEITDATGHTLFTATLHSGQQQQVPGAGPIVVRLGYTPAMTISVDGINLDLSGFAQTTRLTFQSS